MVLFKVKKTPKMTGCQPVILAVFYPKKHPLLDPHRPGITPKWGIKVSKASIFIAWGVF
jgi:hypothetical protein